MLRFYLRSPVHPLHQNPMDETLRQIGQLLLGAIPTVVLFGLLYLSYRVLLHKPLEAVLEERRSRTQGAMEKAQADIASADARAAEYEQRLRDARMAIYQAQESRGGSSRRPRRRRWRRRAPRPMGWSARPAPAWRRMWRRLAPVSRRRATNWRQRSSRPS